MDGRKRRARLAVSTLFLLLGGLMGSWASRIPGVRAQVGLDDAQWGLVILAAPVGTLTALVLVTRVITRQVPAGSRSRVRWGCRSPCR